MRSKMISNSLWMMAEKVISIFGLIFVTSFVAKYVGPSIFGDIALAMSIFQLIQAISQLGSDVLIFKRISKNARSGINLIVATLPIRAAVFLICSLPVLCYSYFTAKGDSFFYVIATFIACFIQAADIYSIYYNAILKSRVNTCANLIGLNVSLVLRWYIAFMAFNPLWLCLPIVVAPLIPLMFRWKIFQKETLGVPLHKKMRVKYTKYLASAGASLVVSSISVAIYTRLSLFIIGALLSSAAVGVFSAAASLASSWSFMLNAIITSALPSIFSERDDDRALDKTARLNLIVLGVSFPVVLGIIIAAKPFITCFYGNDFLDAVIILKILSLSTVIGALGTVSARLVARYSGYLFLSKKMLFVVLSSLIFNLMLIKLYGLVGAAVATLLTELLSLTLFNYPFRRKLIFKLHLKTFHLNALLRSK